MMTSPPPRLAQLAHRLICFGLVFTALCACHRIRTPTDPDPDLPPAYNSPQSTFNTWVKATLEGHLSAIKDCYWQGLGEEEIKSWTAENLKPQAKIYYIYNSHHPRMYCAKILDFSSFLFVKK